MAERIFKVIGAGYYCRWQAAKPQDEQMVVRDRLQQLALRYRHQEYR